MGLAMNKHLLQSARICAVTATSLVLGTTFPNSSWTQAKQSPNIVFILMDNLGYGELGVYGGGITRGAATPHIDKLATGGTRLIKSKASVARGTGNLPRQS